MFEQFDVMSAEDAFDQYFAEAQPDIALNVLRTQLIGHPNSPAKTAVIEHGYIDLDFSDGYYSQVGRAFSPTTRSTKRVHFFSKVFTKRRLLSLSSASQKYLGDSYLGYTVLRPGSRETIGRTFIVPPRVVNGRSAYYPTSFRMPANLAGLSLIADSCPYISQDRRLLACATASLWMASIPLAAKLADLAAHTTTEITAMGLGVSRPFSPISPFSPIIGGKGLRIDQMEHALIGMKCDPHIWQYPSYVEAFDACHLYVESGIAPIMILSIPAQNVGGIPIGPGLHAVTIMGHTMDTTSWSGNQLATNVYSTAEFVPEFVIHDDQSGPYLTARFSPVKIGDYRTQVDVDIGVGTYVAYCKALIAPVPTRVMYEGSIAQRQSAVYIDYLRSEGLLEDRRMMSRTLLIRANQYKEALSNRGDMPSRLRNIYRSLPMPRYIWLVEFGYLEDWIDGQSIDQAVRGELIIDSTNPYFDGDEFVPLAGHVPGAVVVVNVQDEQQVMQSYHLGDDRGYRTLPVTSRP